MKKIATTQVYGSRFEVGRFAIFIFYGRLTLFAFLPSRLSLADAMAWQAGKAKNILYILRAST
jgi:hypothetical protein